MKRIITRVDLRVSTLLVNAGDGAGLLAVFGYSPILGASAVAAVGLLLARQSTGQRN